MTFEFSPSFDMYGATFMSIWILGVSISEVIPQRLICQGEEFITKLVTTIFDRNRDYIEQFEPNVIGNRVENIGLFVSTAINK